MPRILVVEDEQDLREVLGRYLEKNGFGALLAKNGTEGLEMALRDMPELILLDVKMPEMSGYTMLKKLRESNDWGAQVPVIFLTDLVVKDQETERDIEAVEPADYIVKSEVDPEDVIARIRKHLHRV